MEIAAKIINEAFKVIELVSILVAEVSPEETEVVHKAVAPLIEAFRAETKDTFVNALNMFTDVQLPNNFQKELTNMGVNVENIATCLQAVVGIIGFVQQNINNRDAQQDKKKIWNPFNTLITPFDKKLKNIVN
eukprot:gb/GECH01008506.1/.p1 GENE.gb/GECH01008506.1/~~gb/GECH01008506.1/.p1  ORF type:complete len:133 (+),score=15.74 gb/GECH01008506.1/:1-399(+)